MFIFLSSTKQSIAQISVNICHNLPMEHLQCLSFNINEGKSLCHYCHYYLLQYNGDNILLLCNQGISHCNEMSHIGQGLIERGHSLFIILQDRADEWYKQSVRDRNINILENIDGDGVIYFHIWGCQWVKTTLGDSHFWHLGHTTLMYFAD